MFDTVLNVYERLAIPSFKARVNVYVGFSARLNPCISWTNLRRTCWAFSYIFFIDKKQIDQWLRNYNKWKTTDRSSHQRCSVRKSVLRDFAKFAGKHLCQSLFFNKDAGLRLATLLKKILWHRCFPVNFTKFLRTPFLQNTSWRLLLDRQTKSKETNKE